jgi:homoserine dehydrogenase
MRLTCLDKPGVLAEVADILGKNQISIAGVVQKERRSGDKVPVIILTYEARERDMRKALREIHALDSIKGKTLIIRLEKEE